MSKEDRLLRIVNGFLILVLIHIIYIVVKTSDVSFINAIKTITKGSIILFTSYLVGYIFETLMNKI